MAVVSFLDTQTPPFSAILRQNGSDFFQKLQNFITYLESKNMRLKNTVAEDDSYLAGGQFCERK